MKRALIVGASSAIAMAVSRELATQGYYLVLAGRKPERLLALARDLEVRGAAAAEVVSYDALDSETSSAIADRAWGDGLDLLLLAHGSLPEQAQVQDDPQATLKEMMINASSGIALLSAFGGRFEERECGTIAVLSSVAGDRGRQSNYVYGAAKSALSIYTQGLRNRLSGTGVCVLTVKPGFIDTPMTVGFSKGLLWVGPERVAKDILRAAGGRGGVLYTPWFWRYIMWVIKLIPERLFMKLSL